MIKIETLYGQVIGQEVKNQKTLLNFLVLVGKHKDLVLRIEGADYPVGTKCILPGSFSSKKRFKVESENIITDLQDDLKVITDMTGISIPEETYRAYLSHLKTDNFNTAADILSDPDAREDFLNEFPDSGQFIGLINYATTENDAKSLAQVFKDANTRLGFSHALQVAYAMKNRQGYSQISLMKLISQCPWVIKQVLKTEEIDTDILKLEKHFKIPKKRAELYRTASIMISIIKEYANRGDCFISDKLLRNRAQNSGIRKDLYDKAWKLLTRDNESRKIFAGMVPDNDYTMEAMVDAKRPPNTKPHTAVYLPGIFFSEKNAASLYYALNAAPSPILSFDKIKKHILKIEKEFGQKINAGQMEMIKSVCENKITLLTGEAGTGKSYAIKVLAESYYRLTGKIPAIIAPTALAAFRAADNTSLAPIAKTIHRYASIFNEEADIAIYTNKKIKIATDSPGLVIVDEGSMLGPVMLNKLLKKITLDTRVVFAGDPNQLPPVGPGGIFTTMIKLSKEGIGNHVHLTENYRNSEGVIIAAKALLNNQPLPEAENVFTHICTAGEIPGKIIECIEAVGGLNAADTMVMAPYREKGYHVEAINKLLAQKYGSGITIPGTNFKIGDPVIGKRNDYITGGIPRPSTMRKLRTARDSVFNGMKGILKDYDPATQTVIVDYFTGLKGERLYRVEELGYYLELAYATTVHKAQGGQALNIILVLDVALGNKNLLFTALTRCKEGGKVHIITKKEFLEAPYVKEKNTTSLNKFMYRVMEEKNKPQKGSTHKRVALSHE